MKKSNILIAVFTVISAASAVMAEGPHVNFDSRTAGAMSFMEAIKSVEISQNISPASETLPSKSDILVQQDEFYKLNSGDRKKLQAAAAAMGDTAIAELVSNEELSVLFSRHAVMFKELSGKVKPLSEKQNQQTLTLVRAIVGKPGNNMSARFDMDNSTWMQPVCVKWRTEETTVPKKVCKVVNAYVGGGWVGTLVCEMVPTTVTVRVCDEYQSGI